MGKPDFEIGRPPASRFRAELPAIVEPPLIDIPEFPGPDVDSFELFDGDRDADDGRRVERIALDVAFSDEKVREVLGEQRHTVIGVTRRDDDKETDETVTLVVIYLYEDARAMEVHLLGDEKSLSVHEANLVDYHPPPSDEELERAIELARNSPLISWINANDFEPTAIVASDVDEGDQHFGTRRVLVGFGPPNERLPRIRALVDLGTETVIAVTGSYQGHVESEAAG